MTKSFCGFHIQLGPSKVEKAMGFAPSAPLHPSGRQRFNMLMPGLRKPVGNADMHNINLQAGQLLSILRLFTRIDMM